MRWPCLEGVESFDGLGALAPRLVQRTLGLAPARLVARAYLAQSPQRLALALNRSVRATLQLAPHLVHLVEHMKAVIALLGVGEDLSNPRRYPPRRILDHHRQRKPLPLTRAQHLRPRPRIARRTQRQTEQISRVQVHPRQHRLALAEHLVERPGLHRVERALRVEPRRPSLGLHQHRLYRPVGNLHPGIEHRQQVLNRANRIGRKHPQRHHRAAKLCVIDAHRHPRTPEQRRLEMGPQHRLRRRTHRVYRGPRYLIRLAQRRLRAVLVLSCHRRCGTLDFLGGRQGGATEYGHWLAPVDGGLRHLESSHRHRLTASLLTPSGASPAPQSVKQNDQSPRNGADQITVYFLYTFPETRRATPPRHRTLGAGQASDVRARLGAPDHASAGEGG